MGILFNPTWLGQQNAYRNVLLAGGEKTRLGTLADQRIFAQWLVTAINAFPSEPGAAGKQFDQMLNSQGNGDVVVLHGIHTSPNYGLHITVQYGNTAYIGHIDLQWSHNDFIIINFDRFDWRQNQQIARAVNPNFGAHDVEHGIAN
jgi:hypothetical protein